MTKEKVFPSEKQLQTRYFLSKRQNVRRTSSENSLSAVKKKKKKTIVERYSHGQTRELTTSQSDINRNRAFLFLRRRRKRRVQLRMNGRS